MIIWRGWGISVFLLFLAWFTAVTVVLFSVPNGLVQMDGGELTIPAFLKIIAIACVPTAASVWPLAQHRDRVAPDFDHLAYIPMNRWPGVLIILAVVSFGASFVIG